MQEQQLYEYAVIRVVPRVEREEFVNAGIILFCKKTKYVDCSLSLPATKLKCFDPGIDLDFIEQNLRAFEKIALGDRLSSSPIAQLDAPSRFRWLTAIRSTVIQCSKVHRDSLPIYSSPWKS
ncbi:DUF3037 domain-containing protein [Niabella hibiscisoli]|uniref:DUF3037 domain-containing protein n=1 Tax=Niabella hibiscisoli TaxID=1825928 RepID=UPI001F0D9CD5|nr:DUF3037 domain-containing protein [Niabella hibiscisoli]MCH5718710.1 DUF3037 domain-containing protein [Niabella hibiscisoli]